MDAASLVALLSLTIWLYLLAAHGNFWMPRESKAPDTSARTDWPEICAVIPACNEADMLDRTLPVDAKARKAVSQQPDRLPVRRNRSF